MWPTCRYPGAMAKMIQVRHVPDSLHRRLTSLARQSRMSLSDYLLVEMQRSSERPAPAEILARLSKLRPVATRSTILRMLCEERERR
jgi:hypothetical protein